jgi:hypothetical protein
MTESPPIHLALGFHDHQPVGNFPHVFEKHYLRAYLPFLDVMEGHPRIPFSLHLTGPLLLWLCEHHPDYVTRLRRMRASGRIEMKGGGFYEPILSAIPDDDKHEQLRRLSCFLEEQVGAAPEGAWIAERVWEPHLAKHLALAGLKYATLDDSHFLSSGLAQADTLGYYVTEEEGRRFDLFPISKELRYLIPFQEPEATVAYLREVDEDQRSRRREGLVPKDAPPPLLVYDDDGEKFGGWPGTHEHVYGARWLERFLTTLEGEIGAGRLAVTTLGDYRRRFPPLGRIYVPTASYAEMLEWSHGFYRNFLVRYEEANLLHKRMVHTSLGVSRLLRTAEDESRDAASAGADAQTAHRETKRRLLEARDNVLRAQCNDAYWHGVFGGIYLPHLRHAVYAALIDAEKAAGESFRPPLEIVDVDLDGSDEYFLRSDDLTLLVRPAQGGSVVSLDHLATSFALLDTLRRRREPEHADLERLAAADEATSRAATGPSSGAEDRGGADHDVAHSIHDLVRMKEPGLERMLFVDDHARSAFVDHFFAADVAVDDLISGRAVDLGDFAATPYAVVSVSAAPSSPSITLQRKGSAAGYEVSIDKSIRMSADSDGAPGLDVTYRVVVGEPTHDPQATLSGATVPMSAPSGLVFAPEVNVTLLAGWAHDRYVKVDGKRPAASFLADQGTHPGASDVTLVDEYRGLNVRLSWATDGPLDPHDVSLLRHGVVTVSLSEDGFERIYQSTALFPCLRLVPATGAILDVRLRLDVVGP